MKKKTQETEEKSLALEIVHTLKQENKKLRIGLAIMCSAYICLLIYTISLLI